MNCGRMLRMYHRIGKLWSFNMRFRGFTIRFHAMLNVGMSLLDLYSEDSLQNPS